MVQFASLGTTDFVAMTASRLIPQSTPYYATHRRDVDMALEGGLLGCIWLAMFLIPYFRRHAVGDNETIKVDPHGSGGLLSNIQPNQAISLRKLFDWSTMSTGSALAFYAICIAFLTIFVSPWVAFLLGQNPITFVAMFTIENPIHLFAMLYWVGTLAVGLPIIHYAATSRATSLIVVRKLYHIQALIMFSPVIAYDQDFLALAFGLATAVMLGLEYIRACRVPPFGTWLNSFMRAYTDSRDEGLFILTHLYLLLGCAVPVWVASDGIAPYAGVLILGAGDAAAAVIGSKYGTIKWIGGRKTVEGTVAGIVATIACAEIFLRMWFFQGDMSAKQIQAIRQSVILAATTTLFLEAFTTQIDNLVLPLFFVSALRL